MEKDFFPDRSKEATKASCIYPGLVVMICTKEKQRSARYKSDLEKGIVIYTLSKRDHLRGLKCVIYPIRHSINPTQEQIKKVLDYCKIHEREIRSEKGSIAAKFKKGRITYIFDEEGNII